MKFLSGANVLVTGGTGSFGKRFIDTVLRETDVQRVIVFSRDELKQYEMQQIYPGEKRLRFFIGDVRDYERLYRAFTGIDFVVHAAALKHVTAAEYNPFEAVKTNIHGAENIINAAINQGVKKVIALSTDKACSPANLYGATKLVSDKLFIAGNAYAGGKQTRFGVVRYGNVVGSRGSVVPLFKKLAANGELPITDERMTRFWITLEQGVRFVIDMFGHLHHGEIFVPKIPSMFVKDLAKAIAPNAKLRIIGIRPGEKMHEEMISVHDARRTVDMGDFYIIQPEMQWAQAERETWPADQRAGKAVPEDFSYASDTNTQWLDAEALREIVRDA